MGNRRHIGNRVDADTQRSQGANRRLTAWTGTLDFDVEVLDTLFLSSATGHFGSHLSSEGSGLTRALETLTTGRSPRQGVALTVSDGDDGVVERRVHVSNTVCNVLADFLADNEQRCWQVL